mmetsp:Transcript_23826/g.37367  ORF Transcript_23826/g.37367 Transcript_23826/m.37367 type:complete len:323 (-) Transcript_23826:164-1132(-)|eukprot:CAMPEP_0201742462 /NCGR_PEP_ID=MMETSP0593-20130828/47335_1 /ASSEMBLY_ACC=CAM_ASM_000672 /TAXON_ID=267983 /ORGANISM="Skeletonema japonicum, Strain CCMP2506" /LENGTH=322 /DNA_ID=CAMNT_0048236815 /DNA_START=380 /DNA_END=1348 /DNA_ORIENTATION=+
MNINATSLHLTDVMLFSLTPEAVTRYAEPLSAAGCCLSEKHYSLLRKARSYKLEQTKARLRLFITIGGGGRSNGFGNIVTGSPSNRHQFLRRLIKICKRHDFDGIDFDFENILTFGQWEAYLQFLVQASSYLHKHNLLVTVALHPGQFLPESVCHSLDRVHVMAYDMVSHNSPTKHHANFQSVKSVMSSFASNGCPSSKLIMGLPAYARHESDPGLVKTYEEVINEFINYEHEDTPEQRRVKSAIDELNFWKGYRFDSAYDVKVKSEYAKQKNYGGVFLWEIGQDKPLSGVANGGILVESLSSVARSRDLGHAREDTITEEL